MAEYIRDDILDTEEMRKVFVASIPSATDDADLKTFLEGVSGGTCDITIVRREGQEKKNLFGFAVFETSEQVDDLLLNRASLKFNGKDLDVNRAVPKSNTWVGAHEKTKKLFIANLPRSAKKEELQEYLEARHPKEYGTITDVQLIKEKNPDGTRQEDVNKGYGFVFVSSEDMADKMAIQHNNFTFGGRKIELKKSVPSADGDGNRGRGRGRGGDKGMRGGRGGGQFQQSYGGGYDFGSQWDPYAAGYGYDGSYGGGYGGGYAPRGRGGARFTPY